MFGLVVLDFDGTFTQVGEEAEPFVEAFRSATLDLLGLPQDSQLWQQAASQVLADPVGHGWEFHGRIVAPADADPYILATCVAQKLFSVRGVLGDLQVRQAILQALYSHAYQFTRSVFRPDSGRVLEALLGSKLALAVVTNSADDAVRAKLAKLLGERAARLDVVGNAAKFVIADAALEPEQFNALPDSVTLPGFARPMLLKRGHYHDALRRVMRKRGVTRFEDVLVCGDILELDLLLPAELGASVHLVRDAVRHERDYLAALAAGRGGHSVELSGLLDRVRS